MLHFESTDSATTLSKFQSNLDRGHFHRGPLPPAWLRNAARALGAITERANRYLAWSSDRRPLEIGRRSVVLVDEAHKLTASEISALIDATHRHGARVVFLGREQGVYGDVALPRLRPRPEQELPRALADSLKREPEPEVS